LIKWLIVIAAVLAVAAFLTRPGPEDAERALREALYQRLFTTEIEAGREMLGNAAIIACRIEPAACYDVLRKGLDVTYEDRLLYARVTVEGFGRRASCWGAFTRFVCPGGLERAPD
jgi:hypothetical protein